MLDTINQPRTDLALEIRESYENDNVEIKGVELYEEKRCSDMIKVTTVKINNKHGAKLMNKDIGTYITIESKYDEEEIFKESLQKVLEEYLNLLTSKIYNKNILIVGLGNRNITPDSLGPSVIDNLFVTRHLINEYGNEFKESNNLEVISAISPGVMAHTGMESEEIIKGIINETGANLIIVIDALAARSTSRLNKTIQISDTGISPGSGVGNNRKAITKKSVGIDVIAIGVPTVIDAYTIVNDTMENILKKMNFKKEEIEQFAYDISNNIENNMMVTPKNIDESVKLISNVISGAINNCFSISI